MHRVPVFATVLLCVAALWGCASSPSYQRPVQVCEETVPVPGEVAKVQYWSNLRFRFVRDAHGDPQSFLDPLVADQVLAPLLDKYGANISLWRLHRRWPNDEVGHQFSFLLYADAATARAVIAAVKDNPVFTMLATQGLMREAVFESAFSRRLADRRSTSDPKWSPDVQREWPQFIEGASRTWLGLVKAEAERHADEPLLKRYRKVEDALTQLWFKEANHAFFHHLSALFGYKPMRVFRREIMTF